MYIVITIMEQIYNIVRFFLFLCLSPLTLGLALSYTEDQQRHRAHLLTRVVGTGRYPTMGGKSNKIASHLII